MSRITGNDALGLYEAYQSVYAPQEELTEEQVWEEVEAWATSLVEEGYDLSEYTWEEVFQVYVDGFEQLNEMGEGTAAFKRAKAAREKAQGEARMQANVQRAQAPTLPTKPTRGGSSRYQAVAADKGRGGDAAYRAGGGDAAARSGLTRQQIQQKGMQATRAAAAKPAPAPAAKPAAKPAPTPAAAKPAAAKPAPTAAAKPAGSAMDQWAKANPRLAQAQKIRQQGGSRAEVNKSLYNKGTAAAEKTPTVVKASFDMFDVVKAHLIDEGYADTEEAAVAIMANMSEDWKYHIIDEARAEGVKPYRGTATQADVRKNEKEARKKHVKKAEGQKGYGEDEKFNDWKVKVTPGSTLKRKKEEGGTEDETVSQRMDREHPYKKRMTGPMAREYGSRHAAEVTRVVKGAGEPQAVTYPRKGRDEKPKSSKEIIRKG